MIIPKTDPLVYLVKKKYPQHELYATSFASDKPLEYRQEYCREAKKYEAELCNKTPEEIDKLYNHEIEIDKEKEESKHFFNQPTAQADFEHWSKLTYWKLDEAIALSFGKDPRVVNWRNIEAYICRSQFAKKYAELRELALRAKKFDQLSDLMFPGFFVNWFKNNETNFPKELEKKVKDAGKSVGDWKNAFDTLNKQYQRAQEVISTQTSEILALTKERDSLRKEKYLSTKERDTAYKLIICMAIDGYGYDLTKKKSSLPKELEDHLDKLGLHLDVDTIRNWLKKAYQILPTSSQN